VYCCVLVFVGDVCWIGTATTVSPAAHGTANSVDAKFDAAFGNTPATAAQKSGLYACWLADT